MGLLCTTRTCTPPQILQFGGGLTLQNQRTKSTAYQVVVRNINANGQGGAPRGHWTRTLIFDENDYLYVSVGSVGNVDVDDFRSRIRRFQIPANGTLPSGGFDFQQGEIFATGLRNEVGLAFDKNKVLYGVENGADNLVRDDLGGDIHNDNPGEELNRFPIENLGKHYGYPFCWTEYKLPKSISPGGKGTIWAWPSTKAVKNDQWCRDNTVKPVLSMQAHSAPLGITFFNYTYVGNDTVDCPSGGGFPQYMDGDAFIAFHGSWNRNPPTGYKVVRVPMNSNGSPKVDEPIDFLCHGGKWGQSFRTASGLSMWCSTSATGCWSLAMVRVVLELGIVVVQLQWRTKLFWLYRQHSIAVANRWLYGMPRRPRTRPVHDD